MWCLVACGLGAKRFKTAFNNSGVKSCVKKIKLESSAGTGHFYTTDKNKRNTPGKMEIKKYDPVARKHVMYKETKIK